MTETLAQAWVDGCRWTKEMRELPRGATDDQIALLMREYVEGPDWDATGKAGHWNEDPRWGFFFFKPLPNPSGWPYGPSANGGFIRCNGSTSGRHPELTPRQGGKTWDKDVGRWDKDPDR